MNKKKAAKGPSKHSKSTGESRHVNEGNAKGYFHLLSLSILFLLGFLIYSNTFDASFHFDDVGSITENTRIKDLDNWQDLFRYTPNRFLGYFSFALNYHFHQLEVSGYHLVNLAIHLINACIVWWLTLLIFSTPALKNHKLGQHKHALALVTALLFVSHPLATQSITYIVQRLSSMVAMFYLLSVTLYVKARLNGKGKVITYLLFGGALISAVLALFTKENAYTLPFAILLMEIFFFRTKPISINLRDYRTMVVLAGITGFIFFVIFRFSFNIFQPILPGEGLTYTLTPVNYLFTQFSVILKYIQLLLVPANQMVDYDFPIADSFFEMRTLVSFVLLAALVVLAVFLYKKYRVISFGIFWFLLTLAIESSFIPIRDVIFEHRTYLPSFGFFLLLSSLIYLFLYDKYRYLALGLIALIIGTNSMLTYRRNAVWHDELSLWSDNVRKTPNLSRPITNRGFAYRNLGKWDQALADYNRALELNPDYTIALNNRGVVYDHMKQWDMAIADYSRAIAIAPNYVNALSNRGLAYGNLNQWDKAIGDYTRAIEINADNVSAYYNRGIAYGNIKQWDKAVADYTQALVIDPSYINAWHNRGIAYAALQDWDKALADYGTAINMNPKFAPTYYSRGVAYAKLMEWDKAIDDYTKAIEADPNYVNAYYNRGSVYGGLNQWTNAIDDYTSVISLNPNYKEAYVNRAVAYGNVGQMEKAISDYDAALAIDPNFALAASNRAIALQNLNAGKR